MHPREPKKIVGRSGEDFIFWVFGVPTVLAQVSARCWWGRRLYRRASGSL